MSLFDPPGGVAFSYLVIIKSMTHIAKSLSKPNQKNIEPEPGLVLNVSTWYKTKSNLDVHLSEPWTVQFVQVHFTTQKFRPGSAKIFFSGT